MRGVLIDDDEPVARLRDDVGLVQLRARGAERMIEQIRRPAEPRPTRIGWRAPMSNAACAGSAKSALPRPRLKTRIGRAGERRQS